MSITNLTDGLKTDVFKEEMECVRLRCCSPDKDESGFCRFFELPNECSKNDFCEWQCGLNLSPERQRFMSRRIVEEEQS